MKPIRSFVFLLVSCGGCSSTFVSNSNQSSSSPCETYLACLESSSSSNPALAATLAQAKTLYGAGGACDSSAAARQSCDSACTQAIDTLNMSGTSCPAVLSNDDAAVTNMDMSVATSADLSTLPLVPDLATRTYVVTTPHEIDIATLGSPLGMGAAVRLSNLLALTPGRGFDASNHTQCKYEIWAQDPSCTTPPCGILLITQPIPKPPGAMYCPFTSDSGTVLANVLQGDVVSATGLVDLYPTSSTSPAGTVVQHEIDLDALTVSATAQALPAPIAIVDTGLFVPFSSPGWAMYEGTYVKLTPNGGGVFTAHTATFGNTMYTPGGALFADDFKFLYAGDAGVFPADGATYSAVGGVVTTGFGGVLEPISANDFLP